MKFLKQSFFPGAPTLLQSSEAPSSAAERPKQRSGGQRITAATVNRSTQLFTLAGSIFALFVLQDLKQPVLSKKTQKGLGMLPAGYPHESINAITKEEPRKYPAPYCFHILWHLS